MKTPKQHFKKINGENRRKKPKCFEKVQIANKIKKNCGDVDSGAKDCGDVG